MNYIYGENVLAIEYPKILITLPFNIIDYNVIYVSGIYVIPISKKSITFSEHHLIDNLLLFYLLI